MCLYKLNKDNASVIISIFSAAISLVSLGIAFLTFWLTKIKKGTIKMTIPNIICFVPKNGNDDPKIFMRTLLYSTSDKGQIVQNLYIKITRRETKQIFNVWAYGDNSLVIGSGLFIERSGVSINHHFMVPKHGSTFEFLAGSYHLQIYSQVVNQTAKEIFAYFFDVTEDQATLIRAGRPLYFIWEQEIYKSHNDMGREPMNSFPPIHK